MTQERDAVRVCTMCNGFGLWRGGSCPTCLGAGGERVPAQDQGSLDVLNAVRRAAWELCDDTEGTPVQDDGQECLLVPKASWDRLSAALYAYDAIEVKL